MLDALLQIEENATRLMRENDYLRHQNSVLLSMLLRRIDNELEELEEKLDGQENGIKVSEYTDTSRSTQPIETVVRGYRTNSNEYCNSVFKISAKKQNNAGIE